MKILTIGNQIAGASRVSVDVATDSSILKDNKPFFIPDFAAEFFTSPYIAIHIDRLGKNIAAKFAHRYYNEFALALCTVAQPLFDELRNDGLPTDLATKFDGATIISQFLPLASPDNLTAQFRVLINDTTVYTFAFSDINIDIDNAIQWLSKFYTLKIGDVLLIPVPNLTPTLLKPDTTIQGYIDSQQTLCMHIK